MTLKGARVGALVGVVGLVALSTGCKPPQWTSQLVTVNAGGTDAASPGSGSVSPDEFVVSQDGTKVAFVSGASDFGPTDTNGVNDVYIRDLTTGTTTLVSANGAGTNSGNSWSVSPAISPDGTKVAFVSRASDLGSTDTNKSVCSPALLPTGSGPCLDVYVRDLTTGTTTLVSTNAAGTDSANRTSDTPVFSPDGTELAFVSFASDFGPTDTRTDCLIGVVPGVGGVYGPCRDVYVRDIAGGTVEMISVDDTGTNGRSAVHSTSPVFEPDGDRVAFQSGTAYARDRAAGTTDLLVRTPGGAVPNGSTSAPQFSADGGRLVFVSTASDLGPTDTNNAPDVYAQDLSTGAISLVSVGVGANPPAFGGRVGVSADGTKIAFSSGNDVYMRDLAQPTPTLVSVNKAGTGPANNGSTRPAINADGTKVVFTSSGDDLGPTDTTTCTPPSTGITRPCIDIYLRDLKGRTTTLISGKADHTNSANNDSDNAVFTATGRVVYVSRASDLGPTDTNGSYDVYIAAPKK